jgi:hypothetical protein
MLGELGFDYLLELPPETSLDFLYKGLRGSSPRLEIPLDKFRFDGIGIIPWEFSSDCSVPPR